MTSKWILRVSRQGRIVLPPSLLEAAEWKAGDILYWLPLVEGSFEFRSLNRDIDSTERVESYIQACIQIAGDKSLAAIHALRRVVGLRGRSDLLPLLWRGRHTRLSELSTVVDALGLCIGRLGI